MTVADAAATEGDAVAFVVSLSAAGTEAVAVDWAASAGSGDTATVDDFAASGGTLTIAAGETTATAAATLAVYWNEHRIADLERQPTGDGIFWVAGTPQPASEYKRYWADGGAGGPGQRTDGVALAMAGSPRGRRRAGRAGSRIPRGCGTGLASPRRRTAKAGDGPPGRRVTARQVGG